MEQEKIEIVERIKTLTPDQLVEFVQGLADILAGNK